MEVVEEGEEGKAPSAYALARATATNSYSKRSICILEGKAWAVAARGRRCVVEHACVHAFMYRCALY